MRLRAAWPTPTPQSLPGRHRMTSRRTSSPILLPDRDRAEMIITDTCQLCCRPRRQVTILQMLGMRHFAMATSKGTARAKGSYNSVASACSHSVRKFLLIESALQGDALSHDPLDSFCRSSGRPLACPHGVESTTEQNPTKSGRPLHWYSSPFQLSRTSSSPDSCLCFRTCTVVRQASAWTYSGQDPCSPSRSDIHRT